MENRANAKRIGLWTRIGLVLLTLYILSAACGTSSGSSRPPTRPPNTAPPATRPTPEIDPDDLVDVGGGPDTPGSGASPCTGSAPGITVCSYGGNSLSDLAFLNASGRVARGEWVVVSGCNFPAGEKVSVTLTPPTGTQSRTSVVSPGLVWTINWWLAPDRPLGDYRVEARSPAGTFSKAFTAVSASRPTLTTGVMAGQREGVVTLSGFKANESVLLARYVPDPPATTFKLADHRFVQVGSKGAKVDQFPRQDAVIVAIGQERPEEYGLADRMPVSAYDFFSTLRAESGTRFICMAPRGLRPQLEVTPADKLAPPGRLNQSPSN